MAIGKSCSIEYRMFLVLVSVMIAILLYTMGRFAFMDIMGVKRYAQAMLLIPLSLLGMVMIFHNFRIWTTPFFLLPLVFLIGEILLRGNLLRMADLAAATLLVGIIVTLKRSFSDTVLRIIIYISGIFALFGIIQFFILYINPSLISHVLLFYGDYSASNDFLLQYPLSFLGLATGEQYHLFGREITRLRSFTSEPSLLVLYFMLPGALALTYRSRIHLLGYPILLFCVLSLSGSIFLALIFSLISLIVLPFGKRCSRFSAILPFLFLIAFLLFLTIGETHFILSIIKFLASSADFFSKERSFLFRTNGIVTYMTLALKNPLGFQQALTLPSGLLISSVLRSSVFGMVLTIVVLVKIFSLTGKLFNEKGLYIKKQRLGFALIYGVFLVALIFNDMSFSSTFGFTIIVLTYFRLQDLESTMSHRVLFQNRNTVIQF